MSISDKEGAPNHHKRYAPHSRLSNILLLSVALFSVLVVAVQWRIAQPDEVYPHAPSQIMRPSAATSSEAVESVAIDTDRETISEKPDSQISPVDPIPSSTDAQINSIVPTPQPVFIPDSSTVPVAAPTISLGISMGETLSVTSKARLNAILDDIASLGVDWIRVDCSWNTIQPHDSESFSWDAFDRIIASAHERGIRVLPILTYTPRWARASECAHSSKCHPENAEEFANFARAAVERYFFVGVNAWEVWNEPNMGIFWGPHADPGQYTELLKLTYEAIKDVAPTATVVSGGLAPVATKGTNMSALDFTEGMYLEGGKNYFDALGYHPYTYPASPSKYDEQNGWSQMDETTLSIRGIMKYNNDGKKKIWLTEYGAPTGGPGLAADDEDYNRWRVPSHVTEQYQAELLSDAIREARALDFVEVLFWYSYQDLGTDSEDRENFFGLRRYDGSVKPSYATMRTLAD